jgi:hypothetical protein
VLCGVDHQTRACWYLANSMAEENEDLQRKGLVVALFSTLHFPPNMLELCLKTSFLTKTLPVIVNGFHFCYENVRFRPYMAGMQMALGNFVRMRFRAHCGTYINNPLVS